MTMITDTVRRAAHIRRIRFNPIAWLLRLDAAWREQRKFESLDEDRLADMGLTKADRDRAFYQQFADRKLD